MNFSISKIMNFLLFCLSQARHPYKFSLVRKTKRQQHNKENNQRERIGVVAKNLPKTSIGEIPSKP